jgi:hypothetical protein
MRDLGSDEESVFLSAKAARFSEDTIQSALDGYRIAWRPSQQWFQKVFINTENAEEQNPDERINMIVKAIDRKPDLYPVIGQGY